MEASRHSHDLQCQLKAVKVILETCRQELVDLQEKPKASKVSDAEDLELIKRLKAELTEKDELIQVLRAKQSQKEEPDCNHSSLEESKKQLEIELARKDQEIDSLKGKMKCFEVAEEHLEKLRAELQSKNTRLDTMDIEVKSLRSQYQELLSEKAVEPTPARMKEDTSELAELNKDLKTQVDSSKVKIGNLMLENTNLKNELETAKASLASAQVTSQSSVAGNPAELASLKKELSQVRDSYNMVKHELEDIKSDLSIAETSNKDLRTLKTNLQQQLDQSSKIKSDLNTQLIMKDSQLIMTKGQIHDIKYSCLIQAFCRQAREAVYESKQP